MTSYIKILLIGFTLMVLAGCGGSGSGSGIGDIAPPEGNQSLGDVVFNFVLERAVPASITEIAFFGLDPNGAIAFGPVVRPRAQQIRIQGIPLLVNTMLLEYYERDDLVGEAIIPVVLSPNGFVSVENPNYVDVFVNQLIILPETIELSQGQSQEISVSAALSNGLVLDVTDDASYISNDGAVAVVTNGVVAATGLGSTTVEATYRGVTAAVPVTVSAPGN